MLTPTPLPPTPLTLPPVRLPDLAWVPTPPFKKVPVPVRVQ